VRQFILFLVFFAEGIQGGGHSPWSTRYGMATDQVLEFDGVSLNGRSSLSTPDLFWALRGSGGTFVVITSVMMKTAYPFPETLVIGTLSLSTSDLGIANTRWDWIGVVNEALGQLSEAGIMGFHYTTPMIKSFSFSSYRFEATPDQTKEAFAAVKAKLKAISDSASSSRALTSTLKVAVATYETLVSRFGADDGTLAVLPMGAS